MEKLIDMSESDESLSGFSEGCTGEKPSLFLVRPLLSLGNGKVRSGVGVGARSCCVDSIMRECHASWQPVLPGCVGFVVREVTDEVVQ